MGKDAAIPADEILSRSLAEISAADFVTLLNRDDIIDASSSRVLADKKKYELWVDEGAIFDRPLKDLVVTIKREKKKIELEYHFSKKVVSYWHEVDSRIIDHFEDPNPPDPRAGLVESIANAVAAKLRG